MNPAILAQDLKPNMKHLLIQVKNKNDPNEIVKDYDYILRD